jgi:pimeloyl-ACP methyl ester carboxylesterase
MRRILATLAALLFLTGTAQAQPAPQAAADWWRGYVTRSTAIRLPDGRTLRMYCMGSGGPVVIMEAGLGAAGWSWRPVQAEIARSTRACVYDRAGYFGRSTPSDGPRDAGAEAEDLAEMLKASRLPGPYVLVGHSYGGLIARLFTYRYPENVVGLVLVDPSTERQAARLGEVGASPAGVDAERSRARVCAAEPRPQGLPPEGCVLRPLPADLPEHLHDWFRGAQDPAYASAVLRELEAMETASSEQLIAERRTVYAPVVVLAHDPKVRTPGMSPAAEARWQLLQKETAASLGAHTELRVVAGAPHRIQEARPKAVVQAVHDVITASGQRAD